MNYVTFDKFEMFIKNMHCIFHFQYYECIDYENESSTYLGEPNQFSFFKSFERL